MSLQLGADIFKVAFAVYLLAAICYVIFLFTMQKGISTAGRVLLIIGLLVHTVSLVVRTILLHRPPFMNLYEYMVSFTWGGMVVYLALEIFTKNKSFGAFAVPLLTSIAFLAYRLPAEQVYIMPALKSAWRVPHIASAIMAYGAFSVASILAGMYLLAERTDKNITSFWAGRIPTAKAIDQSIYRVIAFGFLMQTLVIIVGAIWAQDSWGRFWGWDPKETWSLITWLFYAVYLHTRTMMSWRGRGSAILALLGFICVIFTFVGVRYGLHSYQR